MNTTNIIQKAIDRASNTNKIINVSNLNTNIRGPIRYVSIPQYLYSSMSPLTRKFMIDDFPIISNNYISYKTAINNLGPTYAYLAEYYKLINDLDPNNPQSINHLLNAHFPAFIVHYPTYEYIIRKLGPNYNYLNDYYNLNLAIRNDDVDLVKEILDRLDPRDYNNLAYHIALYVGNQKYINMIAADIATKNWYEQQVYEMGFTPLVGTYTPARDIQQSYARNL